MQALLQRRQAVARSHRRGGGSPQRQREAERAARRAALVFRRWTARHGLSQAEAAARLGIASRTLQAWESRWRQDRLRERARGRPAPCSARGDRQRLLGLIGLLGPQVGVPALQALCPAMPRREVQEMLRRYRRAWRRRHRRWLRVLRWQRPGAVWAVDFSEAPLPVDGCYAYLLAVRDLSSGMQLLWLPVSDESAQTAIAALEMLFRQQGAPLVLKSDNGSAFSAQETAVLLARWQVVPLRSPPQWPAYNGACEAGIGSMKVRTHHEASAQGRPGVWTSDDAEAARRQANETARPCGVNGPTPEIVWNERRPIETEEQEAFGAMVREYAARVQYEEAERQGGSGGTLTAGQRREAVVEALCAMGILAFRSERLPGRLRVTGRKPRKADDVQASSMTAGKPGR